MITWRRKGQPAPVFWPGQAHRQGSLVAAVHGPQSPSWNQHSAWKTQGSREVGLEMKAPSSHLFGAGFAACPSFLKDIFASRGFLLGSFFFLFSTLNISPSGLWVWWDPPIACGHFLKLVISLFSLAAFKMLSLIFDSYYNVSRRTLNCICLVTYEVYQLGCLNLSPIWEVLSHCFFIYYLPPRPLFFWALIIYTLFLLTYSKDHTCFRHSSLCSPLTE